ncbi:CoA-transferase, partial [Escherichia coli]|uniref:CoA-transferase n=1 Tax=Escherichia coli TaxID=562 RepID=UPI0024BE291D
TLKMPAFEWVHVQLHQQKGMISLSPQTICNSALAADITLVEPDELVETGELQPDHIVTPGAVIDHIIVSQESK